MDQSRVLQQLLRAIALSEGEFALLLARCNSVKLRDRMVAELQSRLGEGLYVWQADPNTIAINLVDVLEDAPAGTQAACITGLESSPYLNDILAIANNAREEFRRRFAFPLVLWVTDDLEAQLRRRAPDLASWAAPPFSFALSSSELQAILAAETAHVLNWVFTPGGKPGRGQELQNVWQECQRAQHRLPAELHARILLLLGLELGLDAQAPQHFQACLALVPTGELASAAHYCLGVWCQRSGQQYRAEFGPRYEQAWEHLQQAWQADEGKQPQIARIVGGSVAGFGVE